MKESMDILVTAKKEYELAVDNISEESSFWRNYNLALSKMLDTKSEEYKSWTSAVRAGAYSTSGGISVGLLVADIFGCLGFCSTVGNAVNWGTTIPAVDSSIAL